MTAEAVLPSGKQFEISYGDQHAIVTEVAASIRTYSCGGRDVLDGYAEHEMSSAARGQPLLPWPNRIRDGRYEFEGVTHQLALSEPNNANAWHGLTRWVNWRCAEEAQNRVVMQLMLYPQPGYPFSLRLDVDYELSSNGLRVTTRASNVGDQAAPFGAGSHPYLTVGTEFIDTALLEVPANGWLEWGERRIPTGRVIPVEASELDFRKLRPLGATHLSTCFVDLTRDADGFARMRFEAPDGSRRLVFWLDKSYRYLLLFTGDGMEDVRRRRRGLGVEPMTCPPDAFRTGKDLIVIRPGETASCAWGIDVDRR